MYLSIAPNRNSTLPQYSERQYLSQHAAKTNTDLMQLVWNLILIDRKPRSAGRARGDQQSIYTRALCCSQQDLALEKTSAHKGLKLSFETIFAVMFILWQHCVHTKTKSCNYLRSATKKNIHIYSILVKVIVLWTPKIHLLVKLCIMGCCRKSNYIFCNHTLWVTTTTKW